MPLASYEKGAPSPHRKLAERALVFPILGNLRMKVTNYFFTDEADYRCALPMASVWWFSQGVETLMRKITP